MAGYNPSLHPFHDAAKPGEPIYWGSPDGGRTLLTVGYYGELYWHDTVSRLAPLAIDQVDDAFIQELFSTGDVDATAELDDYARSFVGGRIG